MMCSLFPFLGKACEFSDTKLYKLHKFVLTVHVPKSKTFVVALLLNCGVEVGLQGDQTSQS